jgi:hypothetical protein
MSNMALEEQAEQKNAWEKAERQFTRYVALLDGASPPSTS